MITPVSNNFNTSRNLEPVEIPHFRGMNNSKQDDTNAANKTTDNAQLRGPLSQDTVNFSKHKQ